MTFSPPFVLFLSPFSLPSLFLSSVPSFLCPYLSPTPCIFCVKKLILSTGEHWRDLKAQLETAFESANITCLRQLSLGFPVLLNTLQLSVDWDNNAFLTPEALQLWVGWGFTSCVFSLWHPDRTCIFYLKHVVLWQNGKLLEPNPAGTLQVLIQTCRSLLF